MPKADRTCKGFAIIMDKNCSTCHHWKLTAFGPCGCCQKITESGVTCNNMAVVQGGEHGESRLLTQPNFSCILHEFRKEDAHR